MAALAQRWVEYKQMEKKDLLGICEKLNIDIIWKAWKDDVIETIIDVQDRLANYDPSMNRAGAVTVVQFLTGYESVEPLPTADPRDKRAERYGIITKNDLVTRCRDLKVNMGWKSSRDDLIEAILNAEEQAGVSPSRIRPINSEAPDQPILRQKKYYEDKSIRFIKRRCKVFRIPRSKRRPRSQLIRNILEMEGKTSGMFEIKNVYVPKGPLAPPLPTYQIATTNGTNPAAGTPSQNTGPWPTSYQHPNHEGITVIYPEQTHSLVGGTGLPIATGHLNPIYERYQNQTQMPIELWYEPLSRTPRMDEAAAKYNEMPLSHLQAIVRARGYTRGITQDCETKLDCIDILLEDDRKTGLLPAAPAPVYPVQPGKVLESNLDPQMFIRNPTEMQVDVLRILQTSIWEAGAFQLSREAFYEKFSLGEMEREVLARRVMYVPHVRRQLVRSDMRMFERVRRRMAGLVPRGVDVQTTQGGAVAATATATATVAVTRTVAAPMTVTATKAAVPTTTVAVTTSAAATTVPNLPNAKSVAWAADVAGSG
ncbi:hypothetical protein VE03_02028 [Pseudogymnoascus sp. 23342-1-I1]|nr:hypothetical protein VE03_02028 [Pseudogymnoascus sp. 23342-1-I1]